MDKISFIATLIEQEKDKGLFTGRWIRPSRFSDGTKHNDYWTYVRDGLDCISPQLKLKNDGFVEYTNFDESDEPQKFTYQEFLDSEYSK
jgi:hypothetical protein